MSSLAWIENGDEGSSRQFFLGLGPFSSSARRPRGQPAFYRQDFFKRDPEAWKIPTEVRVLTEDDFKKFLALPNLELGAPLLRFSEPNRADFGARFGAIQAAIGRGEISKLVPIVTEKGQLLEGRADWRALLAASLSASAGQNLRSYGFIEDGEAWLGLSPEMLFRRAGSGFHSVALAGTRAREKAHELAGDPKEAAEHEFVVEDILGALRGRAEARRLPRETRLFKRLAHLRSEIHFTGDLAFDEIVDLLHPTAALGVFPRSERGRQLLRELRGEVAEPYFGAPFGFESDDGVAECLVSIRNIRLKGNAVAISSGCGVVADSKLDHEWRELALKRSSVKSLFGLKE